MPNGNLYYGNEINNLNPLFVVPNLTNDSLYYIFSLVNPYPGPGPGGLYYSVLDMRLDGGLGDINPSQSFIRIYNSSNARNVMTGTRHHNNKDAWIVLHKLTGSNEYLSYHISSAGIDTIPVVSQSFVNFDTSSNFSINTIKISPDGTRLIFLADTNMEFCSFNSMTGEITHLFRIILFPGQTPVYYNNDAEFSIDNKFVYISEGNNGSSNSGIYQFDATKTDSAEFKQSQFQIASEGTNWNHFFSGMQRGPDNKIYCTSATLLDSISVINKPHLQGDACNFRKNSLCLLPTNLTGWRFPQFLQKYKAYIHYVGKCQYDSISFYGDIWPPPDSIHWDFGDPGSGGNNFSNVPNASHIYQNPGTYTVELFVRHIDKRTDTTWQSLTIQASPHVSLGLDRTICTGSTTTLDAGFCSGCTYEWKNVATGLIVGTNQTFTTGIAGNYCVKVTNGSSCSGYDTVQVVITPIPQVTNNPLSKSICSGESTNILLTSNVPGTNFHWTASLTSGNITGFSADSGLVIIQVLTNSLPTPGVVTYHITPKVGSCVGTPVDFDVTVTPGDSVKVSISVSTNNICAGTLVMFTANPTNPGTSPVYHWKVNGINAGTNSTTFSYTPINSDLVTCELLSSLTVCISNNPATSNSITMSVNPNLPVSVTVTPSQNPICSGTTVNFTAYPVNEGTSPTYQWKVNGGNVGTNNSIYSYTPNNGDTITCTLTSSETCTTGNPAISNQIIMTVNPKLPVSISISASSNPFCIGNSVTFTATHTNGGSSPSYQWKVNGANVSIDTLYTYYPVSGDMVSCVFTSSAFCVTGNPATSNTITMIGTLGLPAGISINANPNPFCPGSSVTCTATPSNGGTNPVYQWKVNGVNVGINSSTYTFNPLNNDSVRCVMTSNLSCVSGNPASSNKIILSGTLAPIVTFTSCFDTVTTLNAKPIKLKGGIPLGGTYSGTGVNSITGVFTPSVAGIGTKTITYSYTNVALCSASKTKTIIVQSASAFTCGNNLTDIRDGKVYPTIQFGSQCWMAADLNYGMEIPPSQHQRDNCTPEKYFNPGSSIQHPASVYQWDEIMQYDDTPGLKGLCPPGWHVPTEAEWNTLFANWTNNAFAGAPLKYSGYSGFNALLSGVRHLNVQWDFQNFATFFWSSTPYGAYKAWAHGMNDYDPSVSLYPASRANAFSIRCLRD